MNSEESLVHSLSSSRAWSRCYVWWRTLLPNTCTIVHLPELPMKFTPWLWLRVRIWWIDDWWFERWELLLFLFWLAVCPGEKMADMGMTYMLDRVNMAPMKISWAIYNKVRYWLPTVGIIQPQKQINLNNNNEIISCQVASNCQRFPCPALLFFFFF